MIIILDYEDNHRKWLKLSLDATEHLYKFSLFEKDIIAARKLIIPDPVDINKSYRKLNLMNLASVLRMVKCPILGINNGLSMMCKEFSHDKKDGLCLFDMNIQILTPSGESAELIEGNLEILKSTDLIDEKYAGSRVYINSDCNPIVNEYTKIIIEQNQQKYSLLFEQNNFYGLLLNVSNNLELFNHIVKNFVSLV